MGEPAVVNALLELGRSELIVPVRSSGGRELNASSVPLDEMRHGSDQNGRFLAVYTDAELFREYGPPGSDVIRIPGARLLALASAAGERIVVDPGAPQQRELPAEIVTRAAATGPQPAPSGPMPPPLAAMRFGARPARGEPAPLSAPDEVPRELGGALETALAELRQVDRAWLLRRGDGWNIGIQQAPAATLSDFDEVRNRLHAVATERLGSRRLLAVTDLRAPGVREQYAALAAPFSEREKRRGLLGRLFG